MQRRWQGVHKPRVRVFLAGGRQQGNHAQDLAIAKEVGDRAGEGRAHANLGCAYRSQGDYGKAIEYHAQDLAIAKEVGDRAGEGRAYGNLGNAYQSQGDASKAIEYHAQDLAIAKEVGDRAGEGGTYGNLGNAYHSHGDFSKAIEYHTQHLAIAKEVGDRAGEGRAYGNLGIAYESQGDYAKAIQYHAQRLATAKEFLRLLFLQAHRESEAHFTAAGMPSQRNQSESFRFKRAAFYQPLKSKVGLAAKAAALRINLNVEGCDMVAAPMHAPSRALLLLPLLLSHNLPLPRVSASWTD